MSSNAASSVKKAISIPYKIKRSPTDLLKALSNTVRLDPNTPAYSQIDDTLLSTINQFETKKNYLSKASGIKAARFMIEKYPPAFMKNECQPFVPSFFPPKVFTEKELKYPDEKLIYSLLSWGKVTKAYEIYSKCKDQQIKVSEACQMTLFDMLCLYNCQDVKDRSPSTEEWFAKADSRRLENDPKSVPENIWKKNGEAEIMFNEMERKTGIAYCSLIKGMAKYNNVEGANLYFDEMKSHNLTPDLSTMNAMIALINQTPDLDYDKKLDLMMKRLKMMREDGIRPNLLTFNNCLAMLKSFGMDIRVVPVALDILKEMELLSIEPSLATYAYLLNIFYPNREVGRKTQVMEQILDRVEKQSHQLEWRDKNDCLFFRVAMEKCYAASTSINNTKRLHLILMSHNNIRFLNDAFNFSRYFDYYLQSCIKYDTPENAINEFRSLSPFIFSGSERVFNQLTSLVNEFEIYDFIPELWSSMLDYGVKQLEQQSLAKKLLSIMVKYEKDDDLLKKFSRITKLMLDRLPYHIDPQVEEKRRGRRQETDKERPPLRVFQWDTNMLSDLLLINLRAKNLDFVFDQFDIYVKNQNKVPGELTAHCLSQMLESFAEADQIDRVFSVLELAVLVRLPELRRFLSRLEGNKKLDQEKRELLRQIKKKLN